VHKGFKEIEMCGKMRWKISSNTQSLSYQGSKL